MAQAIGRILMTGGTGFVGRHLAVALVAACPQALRVTTTRTTGDDTLDGWEIVALDIAEVEPVEALVRRVAPDVVIHLAAQSSVMGGVTDAVETWRANVLGSYALARAVAAHAPAATVLFASSAQVYGASFALGAAHEERPLQPLNAYARSKAAAEALLDDFLPRARLIVARAFNHTGPGQSEAFALPAFAAQIARIERGVVPPCVMTGNLEAMRDLLDVRDVVDAYLRLLLTPGLPDRLTVNVASGVGRRMADLLEALRRRSTASFEVVQAPGRLRPSDVPDAVGDAARLRGLVGWAPSHPIEDTLASLLAHWRTRVDRASGSLAS